MVDQETLQPVHLGMRYVASDGLHLGDGVLHLVDLLILGGLGLAAFFRHHSLDVSQEHRDGLLELQDRRE